MGHVCPQTCVTVSYCVVSQLCGTCHLFRKRFFRAPTATEGRLVRGRPPGRARLTLATGRSIRIALSGPSLNRLLPFRVAHGTPPSRCRPGQYEVRPAQLAPLAGRLALCEPTRPLRGSPPSVISQHGGCVPPLQERTFQERAGMRHYHHPRDGSPTRDSATTECIDTFLYQLHDQGDVDFATSTVLPPRGSGSSHAHVPSREEEPRPRIGCADVDQERGALNFTFAVGDVTRCWEPAPAGCGAPLSPLRVRAANLRQALFSRGGACKHHERCRRRVPHRRLPAWNLASRLRTGKLRRQSMESGQCVAGAVPEDASHPSTPKLAEHAGYSVSVTVRKMNE